MPKEEYWWITARDPETGKPYLIAGGRTENEARQKGLETLGGIDFQLRKFPTRNLAHASALLRGSKLETTHSLKKAAERLGHNKSIVRDRLSKQKKQEQGQQRRSTSDWS